ncbi:DUF55-domain-containing protein [Microstroma glucosiphilum]|uniref:DUF55-domain-containing protein n=1 Tax=Pseudomicrostroma glucosiphilum TaxID=1684307 RepID=A0A316U1F9_9BASI|nr:DUF55-domain-containing protein [Pseudomicrostroma glucosiphilum]PWN18688.1 DUF55-domain-containing protein [Pseudomicrostroma glucosiphilum]
MSHYLLKSEPLPRLEDGVDVSFPFSRLLTSPDQSTTWDGVRNPRAGKTLKGMKVGDEAFWYHSNTKLPEIVGVVKVTVDGENQPDTTAFEQSSPYYDAKSSREKPRWFMPTVKHAYPLKHSLPLSLLQHLTSSSLTPNQRQDLSYLSDTQLRSIGEMDLLRLGRLSVQTVSQEAWTALSLMGDKGGWGEWKGKWNPGSQGKEKKAEGDGHVKVAAKRRKVDEEAEAEGAKPAAPKTSSTLGRQSKAKMAKPESAASSAKSDTRRKSQRIAKQQ